MLMETLVKPSADQIAPDNQGNQSNIATDRITAKQGVPRYFSGVNWIGLWTLYFKEVWRFLKVFLQTLVGPIINGLLFLAIFSLAMGKFRPDIGGISFIQFLAPGLIMMSVIQNAFANTSSSLLIAKIQGNIVDYLMPPLSPGELNTGFALAGVTRGIIVALGTGASMAFFVDLVPVHLPFIIFHTIGASLMMSLLGIITGIWAEKFDHLQTVINFVILPLSFLSGTFYSVAQLPDLVYQLSKYNPFFYMIDGMRYGFTGYADGNITTGIYVILGLNAVLWVICHAILKRGWRLKN